MPELPEVETVRRGLAPALEGHVLAKVEVRRHDLRRPIPRGLAQRLHDRRVERLGRRGKYLLAALDGGETLVMHMGMSGRFTLRGPGEDSRAGPHDHVVLETENGTRITFTDPRRFGLMLLIASEDLPAHELFRGYGPEPLDDAFTAESLSAALKGKRTPIKAALLDQRVVAGLGNIYACEALHRAKISPRRMASSVAGARAARLVPAIKTVLNEAIAAGGSSLRDYAQADGKLGYFQHRFAVYEREGENCPTKGCKGRIKRLVQAGRSTWFCPACQR